MDLNRSPDFLPKDVPTALWPAKPHGGWKKVGDPPAHTMAIRERSWAHCRAGEKLFEAKDYAGAVQAMGVGSTIAPVRGPW